MHDDQHGTAIISSAGLVNALQVAGKKIEDVKIVVNGAGASAVSCTKLYVSLGARLENIVMLDSKGVISKARTDLNEQKRFFATDRTDIHTLEEAIKGADVFLGLSKGNVLSQDMVRSMTGISSSSFRRRSISKHSGALMSSRLIPPKVGAIAFTAAINFSGSFSSTSMSKTSMPA